MKTIWKFPLDITDVQGLDIPFGFEVLTVQMQGNGPCLWALVDSAAPRTTLRVNTFGTGHPVGSNPGAYVATYQTGSLVFHVFIEDREGDPS